MRRWVWCCGESMKLVHSVTLSTFVTTDENQQARKEQFLSLVPFDLEEEKLSLKESSATGVTGNKITILSLSFQKERLTNVFLHYLKENLSGAQKQQLIEQENRLDEELFFYLRFKKDTLPKLVLTDGGDCVHCKLSMAAFPKKKEVARGIIKDIFK